MRTSCPLLSPNSAASWGARRGLLYGGVYFVSAIGIIIEWTPWKGFIFPTGVIPRLQKPLLGTLIRDGQLVSRSCFPRKQKPLLGTLIRDDELVFRTCFLINQKPLLGTLIQDGELVSMPCFPAKTRAPARNADPRPRTCFHVHINDHQ